MSEAVKTHAVRPYLWSVRRELWENPAVWIAPLGVMAVVLFAFLFSLRDLPKQVQIATDPAAAAASAARADAQEARRAAARPLDGAHRTATAAAQTVTVPTAPRESEVQPSKTPLTPAQKAAKQQAKASQWLAMPYSAAAGAMFVTSWLVMIFYSLGALHGERRDRSILFWKSLPVSDVTTVAAKATLPLVVQPLVILPIILAAQLAMLAMSSLALMANGMSPALVWPYTHLPMIWIMAPYGVLVSVLWNLPLFGWLFAVSAWAKRNTFVWAVVPWLAIALFEFMVFHTTRMWGLILDRIFGGLALAFMNPKTGRPVATLADVDVGHVLANPGLWGGLAVGAGFFALAVWLRRTRDPI